MTDKFKDQDSMLPAPTTDKKKHSAKKPGDAKSKVIINPPEKVDPTRGMQEKFTQALQKHAVIVEKKTELVLQSKAARSELPEEVIKQVFVRGYKSLPLNSELTREQYAMNRVNSFVAGGAAMVEDCDLLPIMERMGLKGTGGAMRPHIKREKSVYNGKTVFHVVDAKGNVKHSTGDEFEAKKHLASKYNSYMGESALSPMKRFEGTKSLVKTYKADTPGEGKKDVAEETLNELNKDTLYSYQAKADKQIVAKHRVLGPQIKAGDAKAANKTSATIGKRMVGIDRAVERLNKEEVQLSELSNAVLARYKAKAGEQASAADKAGDFKKGNKRFSGIMKATNKQFSNDLQKEEKVVSGGYRDSTGKLHPPVTASSILKQAADKRKKIADALSKGVK